MSMTKRQKKILVIVGMVGGSFLIFAAFIYLPLTKQLAGLKTEYSAVEFEVSQIKKAAGEGRPLEEAIVSLNERLKMLDKTFPEKEEAILRELSNLLSKLGLEVSSLKPQRKEVLKAIGDSPVNIRGCYVHEMPVSIKLKTYYKTLGEFFRILKEDFPVFVSIESVRMNRARESASGLLNVDLNLNTYLICPEAK